MNKVVSTPGTSYFVGKDYLNSSSSDASSDKTDSKVSNMSKHFESDTSEKENLLGGDSTTNNIGKLPLQFKTSVNVGFSKVPKQIYRKEIQKGFTFNIMLVGATGLGKSTFLNTLFMGDIYSDENPVSLMLNTFL